MTSTKPLRLLTFPAILLAYGCAATTAGYKPPDIRGNEPGIVVVGTRAAAGAGCLATIVVDGEAVGTVGAEETLAIRLAPGPRLVRWDINGSGFCQAREGLATRLVTVKSSPLVIRLNIGGMGKLLIPVAGMFARPEYRILLEGEE